MRFMRTPFLCAAALAASVVTSIAADLPGKAAPFNTEPSKSMWGGFYVGIHAGYGFGEIKPNLAFIEDEIGKFDPKGAVFGGQLGYNWQYSNLVAGVEVDATWLNGKDNISVLHCEHDCGIAAKFDFIGSARGRIGIANGAWLFYGTGGLAWGHSVLSASDGSLGNTSFGWVAGGGIEALLSQHWTFRVEGLHYSFGSDLLAGNTSVNVARAAVNFKF